MSRTESVLFNMPFIEIESSIPGGPFEVPITDHLLVASTVTIGGVAHQIASLNMWCPGTRIAPSVDRALGIGEIAKALSAASQKKRLTKIAEYIVQAFQDGVELLGLQEVPNPDNRNQQEYFKHLVAEIKRISQSRRVQVDVDALRLNFLQTEGHDNFGTSVLINPKKFSIASKLSVIDGHGAKYTVIDLGTQQFFGVVNFHTEFCPTVIRNHSDVSQQQRAKAQYAEIMAQCKSGAICLGDTNSSSFISEGVGVSSLFAANNESRATYKVGETIVEMNTTDAVLVPKKFFLGGFSKGRLHIVSVTEKTDGQNQKYFEVQHGGNNGVISRIYLDGRLTNGNGTAELEAESPLRQNLCEVLKYFAPQLTAAYVSQCLVGYCVGILSALPENMLKEQKKWIKEKVENAIMIISGLSTLDPAKKIKHMDLIFQEINKDNVLRKERDYNPNNPSPGVLARFFGARSSEYGKTSTYGDILKVLKTELLKAVGGLQTPALVRDEIVQKAGDILSTHCRRDKRGETNSIKDSRFNLFRPKYNALVKPVSSKSSEDLNTRCEA